MNSTENNPFKQLKLVEDTYSQIQAIVKAQMKGAALKMIKSLFDDEVENLCGRPFSRKKNGLAHRAGSDPGSVIINGQRVQVKKPRIKSNRQEVPLETYHALNDYDLLCERAMNFMLSGVSTRNYDPLLDEISNGTGLKKSSVSKAFIKASKEDLELINGRNLKEIDVFAIMIDGVYVGGKAIITALSIDSKGKKKIIGIREGETENSGIVKDLLNSLIERGLPTINKILFVIDGSKALKKGIRKIFGIEHPIQRCTIHKGRNICDYLPKKYHSEFYRRWKLLHGLISYQDALDEYKKLYNWLLGVNQGAARSLEEAEMETLTVVKLGVPSLLRKSLHSTNPIESVFSQTQSNLSRVKNWNHPEQASRWLASASLKIEKKFKTIKGYKQIKLVRLNMENFHIENQEKSA